MTRQQLNLVRKRMTQLHAQGPRCRKAIADLATCERDLDVARVERTKAQQSAQTLATELDHVQAELRTSRAALGVREVRPYEPERRRLVGEIRALSQRALTLVRP